jgi:nitrite reductase/ring-hydroxylating ferredoxin subunit
MPPIYDDYIDESGFGEVMTLFNDDSAILEDVLIDLDNEVAIYDDYGDDMYAIKNNDNHETCHHDFNIQSHGSYFVEFAPTTIHEIKFAYVESNKISMLVDHEKNALCDSYIVEFIHDATENYCSHVPISFLSLC